LDWAAERVHVPVKRSSEPSSCSVTVGQPIVHLRQRIVSSTLEQDEPRYLSFPCCVPSLFSCPRWNHCRACPGPTISSQAVCPLRSVLCARSRSSPSGALAWPGRSRGIQAFRDEPLTLGCLETSSVKRRTPDPDAETETIGPALASPLYLPSSPPTPAQHPLLSANTAITHSLAPEKSVCEQINRAT
jgi:hypothetical protein